MLIIVMCRVPENQTRTEAFVLCITRPKPNSFYFKKLPNFYVVFWKSNFFSDQSEGVLISDEVGYPKPGK